MLVNSNVLVGHAAVLAHYSETNETISLALQLYRAAVARKQGGAEVIEL